MLKNLILIERWIEEYFSKCNLRRTYRNDDEIFIVAGHRGSSTFEPENTIPSFDRAVNDGRIQWKLIFV